MTFQKLEKDIFHILKQSQSFHSALKEHIKRTGGQVDQSSFGLSQTFKELQRSMLPLELLPTVEPVPLQVERVPLQVEAPSPAVKTPPKPRAIGFHT